MRSDLGWSTRTNVFIRGRSVPDTILGRYTFSEVMFLHLSGREPTSDETSVFDALLITLLEHGLTPSALATRLTVLGAPESMQGAIAAGILGLGDTFGGSVEAVGRMLADGVATENPDFDAVAAAIVEDHLVHQRPVPGVGHPTHDPVDPRAERLWEIAREVGMDGPYARLMRAIGSAVSIARGRSMPVNATGAIGALARELGLPAGSERGLVVVARAAGLVGHVLEERADPVAREIWASAEAESSAAHLSDDVT